MIGNLEDSKNFHFKKNETFQRLLKIFPLKTNIQSIKHTYIGRSGIRCTDDVAERQYAVMRALKTKLGKRDVQDGLTANRSINGVAGLNGTNTATINNSNSRYSNLIVRLKDLENINKIFTHYVDWLRSNCSIVRLPTLFSEIFDIPISSKSSSSSVISGESIGDDSLVDNLDESIVITGITSSSSSSSTSSNGQNANALINVAAQVNSSPSSSTINRYHSKANSKNDIDDGNKLKANNISGQEVKNNPINSSFKLDTIYSTSQDGLFIIDNGQLTYHLNPHFNETKKQDFFFDLSTFQDTDDKIDGADLNPSVDCLVVNMPSDHQLTN